VSVVAFLSTLPILSPEKDITCYQCGRNCDSRLQSAGSLLEQYCNPVCAFTCSTRIWSNRLRAKFVEAQDLQSPGYCTLLFCKPAQMVVCIPGSFPGSHPPTATMSQVWIILYPLKWACFSCFSCATDAGRWTAWGWHAWV